MDSAKIILPNEIVRVEWVLDEQKDINEDLHNDIIENNMENFKQIAIDSPVEFILWGIIAYFFIKLIITLGRGW